MKCPKCKRTRLPKLYELNGLLVCKKCYDKMKEKTYEPKIHYNYNGKAMCGMKVSKKRLTKKIPEMTCRLCWKGNGLKVNSKEVLQIKRIMKDWTGEEK